MDNIEEVVKVYILKEFVPGQDRAELTASTPLVTGGIRDRLAVRKLVAFLEDRLRIRVKARKVDVGHLGTISVIATLSDHGRSDGW